VLRKSHSLREVSFYVTLKRSYGEQNRRAQVFRRQKFCYPKLILTKELTKLTQERTSESPRYLQELKYVFYEKLSVFY
jgi:hypothetical protein